MRPLRRPRHPRTLGLLLLAGVLLAPPGVARSQILTTPPEPLTGFGVEVSPGILAGGAAPTDTVATFVPYLSTVTLLPRPLVTPLQFGPAAPENLALDAYLESQRRRQADAEWQQSRLTALIEGPVVEGDSLGELRSALRLPDEITSLFGGGSSLDVNGRLRVSFGGGTTTLNPDLRPPGFPDNNLRLDLDQLFELDVRGTIGRKLNLAVDFNSEREFQNKNVLSAFYVGDEDEILRRFEVGDITVSLPPSRFINVGATKGNFGVQGVGQLGPLSFRAIGSRKEGETTQRSLSITPRTEGVIETSTVELKDTQFQNNRFFLLFHPDSLASPRIAFPNQGTTLANPASTPGGPSLNVWRDNGNPTDDLATNAKPGTAFADPRAPEAFPDEAQQGFFNLLVEGQDYYVVDNLVLTTDRPLNANETLAVSYVTVGGDTLGSLQGADTLQLKLIKPVNPDSLDFTWDYTLRNVYPLRATEVLLQDLTVYRGDRQLRIDFEDVPGQGGSLKYSQILGVADASERPLNQVVGKDPFGGPDFLVFPDLQPFASPVPFPPDTLDLTVPNRQLYNVPPEQRISATQDQVYFVSATYRGRAGQTNEVELGALNILEGSETITLGGVDLERGKDYQIFYDFGRLVFTEPDALFSRFPGSQVEISFEVAPLFNLAPTTVAGFNAVYQPHERLFVNSSVIMQSTESLSNRPILGAEPTRSILGEVDGNWDVDLPFLTQALDDIPLLRARGPSTFRLRGEMALNLPNPNTEGRVFLNDFEAVELASTIGLNNRTYVPGSPPANALFVPENARQIELSTRALPLDEVITNQQVGNRAVTEVLRVLLGAPLNPGVRAEDAWRSVTHRISVQGADVSRQESIQFFLRSFDQGRVIVDLGSVSEDGVRFDRQGAAVGLGRLDSEDVNRDNQLDAAEDRGLDGVAGADAAPVPGDDGNDDFSEAANPSGTEGNRVLDTEDLNVNGVLDERENLVRWVIDLANNQFEVPGSLNESEFRQIRLPLSRPTEVFGSPDLRRVQAIRFTFAGFGPSQPTLELAQLEINGSTFLERGVVDSLGLPLAGDRSDTLSVSEVNTLENADYFSPPGVRAEQERADEVIRTGFQPLKEQSLVLAYDALPAGAEGRIYQPLNDRENYLDYERMEIFTNGQSQFGASGQPISTEGRLPRFFVEFGTDTLNVYRFTAPLRFNTWEQHVIEFGLFTDLKAELLASLAASGGSTGSRTSADGRYQVILRDGQSSPPSLSQVSQLTIGVRNDVGEEISAGSFWVDDWRLTSPVTDGGVAQYASASTQLADFGTVDLQFENREARFRNLDAAINNRTSRDFDVRSTFRIDRLLPAALGLEMPLTVDRFSTTDRPLFLVGSDLDLEENAELRDRQAVTTSQSVVTIGLRRSQRSRNWLLRSTVDRLDARFTIRRQDFGSLDLDRDDDAWDLTLRYDTDFARRPIRLPFGFLGGLPLPGFIKDSKAFRSFVNLDVNPVPSRISLVGTSLNANSLLVKRQGFFNPFSSVEDIARQETADSTRTGTGDLSVTFQPTNSLRANYSLSSTRDFNFPDPDTVELGDSPLPGVEALRTQRFDFQWTPPVTDWLVPRYNYNASYGLNHTREVSQVLQGRNLRDFTNQDAKGWTVELNVPVLLDRALGGEPTPGAPGAAPPRPGETGFQLRNLLQPIRFESSKRQSSAFRQVGRDPAFRYTFGLQDPRDPALPDEAQNIGEVDRLALATGLTPLSNLVLQGGYERNDNQRLFFGGENKERQFIWPRANVRYSLPAVPGFLGAVLDRVDVTSDFQNEHGDTRSQGQKLSDYERFRWAPLVGVDATWFGGLITNFRALRSENETTTVRGGATDNVRTESSNEYELTVNYLFRPGTRVFLPIPFLMGDRIKGPLRTSLTMARRLREDETVAAGAAPPIDPDAAGPGLNAKTTTIEIRPALSYDLNRLSSGLAFSYLLRQDEKRDVDTTTYSLELFVDLTF